MKDIPGYDTFVKIEPIYKGQSNDDKYFIEAADGKRMLLRMTDIKEYDRKRAEYCMMEKAYNIGVLTPQPYDFGLCNNGNKCYSLVGWFDGKDAESIMPNMSESDQYCNGWKAGAILRNIHMLPAPDNSEPWCMRFRQKVQTRVDLYEKHNLHSDNGEIITWYLHDNQALLDDRPQTFWHGDFNLVNHMIMSNGEVGTLDYNYWNLDHGDPWYDLTSIIPWGKEPPAFYFTGMINGYFDNDPPHEFFKLLSYYYACDALSALCYSFLGIEPYAPEDGRLHMENVLRWFNNMNNSVPTWYLKNYYIQCTDGVL